MRTVPEDRIFNVETRKALVFYVERRWRLNQGDSRLELERIEVVDGFDAEGYGCYGFSRSMLMT